MSEFFTHLLTWDWLVVRRPVAVWWAFFFLDFGVMSAFRVFQVLDLAGPGPYRGHWSFWMVVLYDTLALPIAAALVAVYMQKFPGSTSSVRGWMVALSVVAGLTVMAVFLLRRQGEYRDWTLTSTGTLTLYGIYHSLVLAWFVQYFMLFWIRATAGLVIHYEVRALAILLAVVFLVVFLAPFIFLAIDEGRLIQIPTPGELLSHLPFMRWAEWW